MKISLIPREVQFFDLVDRSAQYIVEGAALLRETCRDFTHLEKKLERLNGIEHACDEITHTTLDKLETTFITPLDREDIHELILRMDDVMDMINAAVSRLKMFRVTAPRKGLGELGDVVVQQCTALLSALSKLRDPKQYSRVTSDCIEIHRLENEADDITKEVIGELFDKETNAIELLRWKEIYEALETVTDCAEDVANVIQGIVVKNA